MSDAYIILSMVLSIIVAAWTIKAAFNKGREYGRQETANLLEEEVTKIVTSPEYICAVIDIAAQNPDEWEEVGYRVERL